MKKRLSHFYTALRDNAMLYKDMTQWLRNRTFLILFFSLLVLAEGVSALLMFVVHDVERPGAIAFYLLYLLLAAYALVVAFMGHSLTSREFMTRTFELYELSGMSLERMIGGKIFSMLYQFFFGFCCIVPFMFFSYYLGGLDFLQVVGGVLLAALVVLPLYLATLLTALTARMKQIATLGKFAAVLMLIAAVWMGLIFVFSRGSPAHFLMWQVSTLLKALFSGNKDVFKGVGLFLLFYVQICLLLFYLCCNTVSRRNDSREIPVKVLCYTLSVCWMGFLIWLMGVKGFAGEAVLWAILPVAAVMCVCGVMMFYGPMRVPSIIENKYRDARGRWRAFYYLFQPGPRGLLRYLVFVMATAVTMSFFGYLLSSSFVPTGHVTPHDVQRHWVEALSMLLQIPFFLIFPLGVFLAFAKKLRDRIGVQRTLVAVWWGAAGAVASFYLGWAKFYHAEWLPLVHSFSLVASPLSSIQTYADPNVTKSMNAALVRMALGVLGFYLMWRALKRRDRMEAEQIQTGSVEPAVADTGMPA